MITTGYYLDLRYKSKDGKGKVLVYLHNGTTTAFFSTGVRVSPENWRNSKVAGQPDAKVLNLKLSKLKLDIDTKVARLLIDDSYNSKTAFEIKQAIQSDAVPGKVLISDIFNEYISNGMKDNTKDIYLTTLKKIEKLFGRNVCVSDIDLKWLHKFDNELAKTQCENGRSIYLRCLRTICNYAKNTGRMETYPFSNFTIKQKETRKRSISVEDMRKFLYAPVTKKQSYYRDYFFLMFYLIGINAKDLLLAKKSAIVNGRFEYIREKTGKKYSIKIEPEAKEILDRYAGNNYLLEAMDHCKNYKNFTREINEAIQSIEDYEYEDSLFSDISGALKKSGIPALPGITTYYARHSWATFAYEIEIPMDTISQALGHSFGNRTTLIYVRSDQKKVDEANRKVIDYLCK